MDTILIRTPVDFATGASRLGLAEAAVRELVELRQAGDCARVQARMAELVTARLQQVHSELGGVLSEQASAGGLGAGAGAEPIADSMPLWKTAGRLQAAADILADPPATGGCTEDCACTRAPAVIDVPYVFPSCDGTTQVAVTAGGLPIVCTLDADGEDLVGRVGQWQTILAEATARETTAEGVAVTFSHDIARTAELARLLAAEYSCCSFASYHLTIDARGVRIEIHAPQEARDALAAVFGVGDQPPSAA
jgi:hypothetical protein